LPQTRSASFCIQVPVIRFAEPTYRGLGRSSSSNIFLKAYCTRVGSSCRFSNLPFHNTPPLEQLPLLGRR
jgi:hypothetical protein